MNRISLYILLILLFLALSRSFSPSSQGAPYIIDERVFSNYFKGDPISVILVDSFTTGFLIKTYFQKYKIVYGFSQPEILVIRTSQVFWKKNLKNTGMSLFRRSEGELKEEVIPLPPGSLYIGNLAYGNWKNTNSGQKVWRFHRAYRHFPAVFGWSKEFKPTLEFFKQMTLYKEQGESYYGTEKEFGTDGSITQLGFGNYKRKDENKKFSFKNTFKKYITVPKWSKEKIAKIKEK